MIFYSQIVLPLNFKVMKNFPIQIIVLGLFVMLTSCSLGYLSSFPLNSSVYNTNQAGGYGLMNGNSAWTNGNNFNFSNRGYYNSTYNGGNYNYGFNRN
jgi:hypothetical protein